MNGTLVVPETITQEMADAIGCTPEQYNSIVRVACLFVPPRQPYSPVSTDGDALQWPYQTITRDGTKP